MVILERHDQVNAELDELIAAAARAGRRPVTRRRTPGRRRGRRGRPRGRPRGLRRPARRSTRRPTRWPRPSTSIAPAARRAAAGCWPRSTASRSGRCVLDPAATRCTCAASASSRRPGPGVAAALIERRGPRRRRLRRPHRRGPRGAARRPSASGSGTASRDRARRPVRRAAPAAAAVTCTSPTPTTMRELGERLGRLLRAGDLVVLTGELGAGKTTFTQGLGAGLGVRGAVTSPTFVIARVHPSLVGGPGAGARRRLPARRHRRARRPRPRHLARRRRHRRRVGRGHRRGPGRRAASRSCCIERRRDADADDRATAVDRLGPAPRRTAWPLRSSASVASSRAARHRHVDAAGHRGPPRRRPGRRRRTPPTQPMKHGEHLAPADRPGAGRGRQRRQTSPRSSCGVGPGPFTGLRVGAGHRADARASSLERPGLRRLLARRPRRRGRRAGGRRRASWSPPTRAARRSTWASYDADGPAASRVRPCRGPPTSPTDARRSAGRGPAALPRRLPAPSIGPDAAERRLAGRSRGGGARELLDPEPLYLRRPDAGRRRTQEAGLVIRPPDCLDRRPGRWPPSRPSCSATTPGARLRPPRRSSGPRPSLRGRRRPRPATP